MDAAKAAIHKHRAQFLVRFHSVRNAKMPFGDPPISNVVNSYAENELFRPSLASKTASDSCAGLPLAIIERRFERQMHVCLSNNVAKEMTNDAATVLSTDNCRDSVTLYGRTGRQRAEYLRRGDNYLVPVNF